ncbi:MAG: hypothetical protein D6800_08705 [Candidatus Zixiibacteriota bacterium]|nr:MAG: hypothetical protein D6800_08705 [candidate division Zixibacteria bacterium]
MKLPDMPSAVVSAAFFVVVFLAEMFLGRETVEEVFRQMSVIAASVATIVAWLLRLWQEYQRLRTREDIHTMDRDATPSSLWRRWLWG